MSNGAAHVSQVAKKSWHEPAFTKLDFDRTALITATTLCDSGCCCCSYTVS